MVTLTPRQVAAFEAIEAAYQAGCRKQLVSLPTGTGKTVLACFLAKSELAQPDPTLFLCHRQELVAQTAKTMALVDPTVQHGLMVQGVHEIAPFTIGMIQTVHNRLDRLDPTQFGLVIIDECHHAAARTWRAVADHFQPRLRLGLSATPERADGAPLSNLFDRITYEMTLAEAVKEGCLAQPSCVVSMTGHSLADVRTMGGDFQENELAEVVNTPIRNRFVVTKYLEYARGRRALCFTAGVQHAKDMAAAFQEAGIKGQWISGDDPERADKLARFASGGIAVLANAMILTEGFDDPGISAVLMARPTKSRTLYAQMIGRGLRLAEGKSDCKVIDFVDNSGKHTLVGSWLFLGKEKPPPSGVPEHFQPGNAPGPATVKVPSMDVERVVDLLKPPPVVNSYAYGAWEWHYAAATEKQLAVLERAGYDTRNTDWTRGQASSVIGRMPASSKQTALLLACGYDTLSREWTRDEASKALEAVKQRGVLPDWKFANMQRRRVGPPGPQIAP